MNALATLDAALHDAAPGKLEQTIMELTLSRTSARHGAVLLWDEEADGLAIAFHVVEGLIVTLPNEVVRLKQGSRFNGIASYVFSQNAPYLCHDALSDPYYAPYYFDVTSIAAVPIPYQGRPIGVLSISSRKANAFTEQTLEELSRVADASAKYVRRAQLSEATEKRTGRPFLIKGLSSEWLEVERRIEKVAGTNAPVLITGESGTGKELTAHAIHFNSQRLHAPFVTVNCAAIPEALLESVLFGHVKGAFTGATADKKGEFQKADGGTLFLDELGELPVPLQAKVLRALESGEVQPVGSNHAPESVDVRVVCATNRDLPQMMRRGEFRDDLYYRLSVMTMSLPPLRSYKADNLPVIAQVFLKQASERNQRTVRRIAPDAVASLLAYDYPGNVRELKNAIEHGVIMADGDTLRPEDLPRNIFEGATTAQPNKGTKRSQAEPISLAEHRERWLAPLETTYLRELMASTSGNVRVAAGRAGINHVTLYRLLKKRGLGRGRQEHDSSL